MAIIVSSARILFSYAISCVSNTVETRKCCHVPSCVDMGVPCHARRALADADIRCDVDIWLQQRISLRIRPVSIELIFFIIIYYLERAQNHNLK